MVKLLPGHWGSRCGQGRCFSLSVKVGRTPACLLKAVGQEGLLLSLRLYSIFN